ncbi:MAG TPA: hypothetical protein PKH79_02050 [Prolixibacteraceae bacterium]|nr:hypothetical protein [Prolixibacteraceae bacterium]HPS12525.1 hypothetical protein [Prolixibacteraceae bacterium]
MKKFLILLLCGLWTFAVSAQKESGKVFSEHQSIEKTKTLWDSFVKGDKETFMSFWADSVYVSTNGVGSKRPKQSFEDNYNWWRGVEKLEISQDSPATPDAIVYKEGGLWVQDWLRVKGIHKETGIRINWPIHNLYAFNKEGKIYILCQYYDNAIFKEIENSFKTRENGKIYIKHPYIVTVRKLVNAYCAEDIETLFSIYSSKAFFGSSYLKTNQFLNVEEKKKDDKETFAAFDNMQLDQVGYPDCIYYEQEDLYTVYSWWTLSCVTKDGKKFSNIPVMLMHTFDKEGKISNEYVYMSKNQME